MKFYTVLGIHHSGTTCLAETLIRSGVQFARVLRNNVNEDHRVLLLHARLTNWSSPKLVHDATKFRELFETFVQEGVNGFKEPSTLWTIPAWRQVAAEHDCALKMIGTFRHPALVMEHFRSQLQGADSTWDHLWCAYMERMLAEHDVERFPLVCFDDEQEAYGLSVSKALFELGLVPTQLPLFDLSKRRRRWPTTEPFHRNMKPSVPSERALEIYEELRNRL